MQGADALNAVHDAVKLRPWHECSECKCSDSRAQREISHSPSRPTSGATSLRLAQPVSVRVLSFGHSQSIETSLTSVQLRSSDSSAKRARSGETTRSERQPRSDRLRRPWHAARPALASGSTSTSASHPRRSRLSSRAQQARGPSEVRGAGPYRHRCVSRRHAASGLKSSARATDTPLSSRSVWRERALSAPARERIDEAGPRTVRARRPGTKRRASNASCVHRSTSTETS
mmetsp:Transcript_51107/g.161622  ORF Transcript_51107/g.161622 Transcript_51107/m.161622 type:complete len:231 (+) Transcript_51107:276-968(+)